jgi:hypothetical protein
VAAATVLATTDKALCVANATIVVKFTPAQFVPGVRGTVPRLRNSRGLFAAPQGVASDAAGKLWDIDRGNAITGSAVQPDLFRSNPVQLVSLGAAMAPPREITIRWADLKFPQRTVFDANGNLWLSDNDANAAFVLSAAQLQ